MGFFDSLVKKVGIGSNDYPKAGDKEAAKLYAASKRGRGGSFTMKDSWEFLHDIAELVENKFSKTDKNAVYELGGVLFLKYNAQYIHLKEYGVRQVTPDLQSTEQSKTSADLSR